MGNPSIFILSLAFVKKSLERIDLYEQDQKQGLM
jgi:hypothetical protein